MVRAWALYVRRRRALYEVGHRVVDRGEARLLRDAFQLWWVQARGLRLATAWQATRAVQAAVKRWRGATQEGRAEAGRAAAAHGLHSDIVARMQRRAIAQWRGRVRETKAVQQRELDVLHWRMRRAMRGWQAQVPAFPDLRLRAKAVHAVTHCRIAMQRRAFLAWHRWWRELAARGRVVQEGRRRRRSAELFTEWRQRWQTISQQRRDDEQRASVAAARRDASAFSSLFHHWLSEARHCQAVRRLTHVVSTSIMRRAVEGWRTRVDEAKADAFRQQTQRQALRSCIHVWREVSHTSTSLRRASSLVTARVESSLRAAAFRHWRVWWMVQRHRRLSLLRLALRGWQEVWRKRGEEKRVMTLAWMVWREEVRSGRQMHKSSHQHYRRRALLPAITVLRQHAQHRVERRRKEALATSHYHTHLATSHPTPILRTAYLAWYYFTRHRRLLTSASSTITQQLQTSLLHDAFTLWHHQTTQLTAAARFAAQHSAAHTLQRWIDWTRDRRERKDLQAMSAALRDDALRRRARGWLNQWWERTSERRVVQHERRLADLFHLQVLFIAWGATVPTDPSHRIAAKQRAAEAHHRSRMQRQAVLGWRRVVGETLAERHRLAEEWQQRREEQLRRTAMGAWKSRLIVLQQWQAVASKHFEESRSRQRRRQFELWRGATLQAKGQRSAVQRAQLHFDRKRLHSALTLWRAVTRADSSERQRVTTVQIRQHRALRLEAFSVWVHHTQLSQAASVLVIATDRVQQRNALDQWKDAVLLHRAVTHATLSSTNLLSTTLRRWHHFASSSTVDRAHSQAIASVSHQHLLSTALRTWRVSLLHHRHAIEVASVIKRAHERRLVREVWVGWKDAKLITSKLRVMALKRWWLRWKVARMARRVHQRTLTQTLLAWRRGGKEEKEREETSQRLMVVKLKRQVMESWRKRSLLHRLLHHWRQQTSRVIALTLHLASAARHHQLTLKRRAVHRLHLHRHLAQVRRSRMAEVVHHYQSHLLRHCLLSWREGAQQSAALTLLNARAMHHQREGALSRWQDAAWHHRAVHFHRAVLSQRALSALHDWTLRQRRAKEDDAAAMAVRGVYSRRLLVDSFTLWLGSVHRQLEMREEEERARAEHDSRLARAVLLFWYNASAIHRHFRLRSLKAAFAAWSLRMQAIAARRHLQRQTLLAWRDTARCSVDVQRNALLQRQRQRLSASLQALLAFTRHRRAKHLQLTRAVQWERGQLQRKVWTVWQLQQHLSQTSRTQMSLATQRHLTIARLRVMRQWRLWVEEERHRKANVAALHAKLMERRKRSALQRWHEGTSVRRKLQRLQLHTLQPTFLAWTRLTTAVNHHHSRLLSFAWHTWTAAAHDRSQWRKAEQLSARRALAKVAAAFREWRGLCGAHTAVLIVGERVRDTRRRRLALLVLTQWRQMAEAERGRMRPLLATAEAERRHRLLCEAWSVWRRHWEEQQVERVEMEQAAVALYTRTVKRRVMDVWEERTGERLKARHLHSSQTVRLSIAMRAYHTSLLLHTFSQWRAAAATVQEQRPPAHTPSSSLPSGPTPPPRLTSLHDLRQLIEQQRMTRPPPPSAFLASSPPTPFTSTSTDSPSPSSASDAALSSRPSTVDSVNPREAARAMHGQAGGGSRGAAKAVGHEQGNGWRREAVRSAFPRIDMRDL